MKHQLSSLLALTTLVFSSLEATNDIAASSFEKVTETVMPKTIQILIEKDADSALLEVKGPYYLFDPNDGSYLSGGLLSKRFMMREGSKGLKWGEEFRNIHQLYIKPRSEETSIFINGIQYSGSVYVYGVKETGKIHIVNEIDIESYVKSILTAQFPTPLEPEVMAALAIVTRTNAYHHCMKNPDSFWQVSAHDAGYTGSALIVNHSSVVRAVDSTKNLILLHPSQGKNMPFAASWTEHSAGKTAAFDAIFRKESDAPEKGVEAPHAALSRQESKWSYQISKKRLASLLGLQELSSIEVFIDPPSGKVYGIRCKDKDELFDLDFLSLQTKLGKKHLPSSDFTLSLKDDMVSFTGFGKGHGVGLCLYSASALAQNGENAVKILAKFFPDTYLYNINSLPKD